MSDVAATVPPSGEVSGVHSVASVATPHASRYLQQLCKHFAHKRAVSFDERHGRIDFAIGICDLEVVDGALRMRLAAPNGADLAQLADVVQRHLVRFAFREELAIRWETR
ncbi:DUF2218 domain-containing protein [Aureimonas leprariae]|uniref:DUF2218 domain-containing protein n=1 Tax=Plantimonas leprariae TaxID=2615207 RepID=A0A7V7PMD7_9HYPH|nr:DUF2218 domain-containing protein [Aureimonas leprariae]KAB0678090.1 DUF2218 domain-containing protein [Aureimonas leprariae]